MAFAQTWDASFEALPTDSNYMYEVDDYIRNLKEAIRERMEIDHIWKVGATDGTHKQITLSQISAPTLAANTLYLYCKDVSAKIELFAMDEDGDEIQITSGGGLNPGSIIPVGTKMLFYADSAPTGWTLDSTPSDELIAIKGGTTYTTGGASAGSWTLAGITVDNHADHTHGVTIPAGGFSAVGGTTVQAGYLAQGTANTNDGYNWSSAAARVLTSAGVSSALTHTVNHGNTWRPKARVCIICSKN